MQPVEIPAASAPTEEDTPITLTKSQLQAMLDRAVAEGRRMGYLNPHTEGPSHHEIPPTQSQVPPRTNPLRTEVIPPEGGAAGASRQPAGAAHTRREDQADSHPFQAQGHYVSSPFVAEILTEPPPTYYKKLDIERYNGHTDPREHMEKFEGEASLHCYSDAVMCRAFRTSLTASALSWFRNLSPGSITCFSDLRENFLKHFASSITCKPTATSLLLIKQQPAESLRKFVARFNTVAREATDTTPDFLVKAISHSLKESPFLSSLMRDPTHDYSELMARAEKYMNEEDTLQARREEQKLSAPSAGPSAPSASKALVRRDPPRPLPQRFIHPPPLMIEAPPPRPLRVMAMETALPAPRTLMEQEMVSYDQYGILQRPRGYQGAPRNPPAPFFCQYHMEFGHSSDRCFSLQSELSRIRREYPQLRPQQGWSGGRGRRLSAPRPGPYNRRPQNQAAPRQDQSAPDGRERGNNDGFGATAEEAPTRGVINVISGGPTDGVDAEEEGEVSGLRGRFRLDLA